MSTASRWHDRRHPCLTQSQLATNDTISKYNVEAESLRIRFLEQQASDALQVCATQFENPVFPCALIAGDVVILHLLHKHGLLDKGTQPEQFYKALVAVHADAGAPWLSAD